MSLRDQAIDLATAGARDRRDLFQDPDEVVTFQPGESDEAVLTTAYFGAARNNLEFGEELGGFSEKYEASMRVLASELAPDPSLDGKVIQRQTGSGTPKKYRIDNVTADEINVETVVDLINFS